LVAADLGVSLMVLPLQVHQSLDLTLLLVAVTLDMTLRGVLVIRAVRVVELVDVLVRLIPVALELQGKVILAVLILGLLMAQRRVAVEAVRRNLAVLVLQGPQAVKVVMVLTGNHLVQLTLAVAAVQHMALV
jgi:hypothetical protein